MLQVLSDKKNLRFGRSLFKACMQGGQQPVSTAFCMRPACRQPVFQGPEQAVPDDRFAFSRGMLGTLGSNNVRRSSLGLRQRRRRPAMSWSYRKHTGRKQRSLRLQDGTACRQPSPQQRSQLRLKAREEGAQPNGHFVQRGPRPKKSTGSRDTSGPSTTRGDGVMVLLSSSIPPHKIRWKG